VTGVLGIDIPRATAALAVVLAIDLALILVFFKELKIVAFDPYLARTMGFSVTLIHYGLMAAVAMTTVASFEAVGSILVVAMLIAPGATAHLLTDRLGRMLVLSAVVAIVSAVAGYVLAVYWNTSTAGMMSVAAGAQFALAVFFSPRYGYLSKLLRQAGLGLRILREDILGILYRWQEAGRDTALPRQQVLEMLGHGLGPRLAAWLLARRGQITRDGQGHLRLTPVGAAAAKSLIRSHRLWESYLAKHFEIPLSDLHERAEQMEHFVSPEIQTRLSNELTTHTDPHGRDIPGDLDSTEA
jgi:manganese/zinc/iron transport system permease protein